MKIKLTLEPGVGILPIKLGMTRDEVAAALKTIGIMTRSAEHAATDYYFENAIQIEFTDGTASFIGIASDRDIELVFQGASILQSPARDVFKRIAAAEGGTHKYDVNGKVFRRLIVTLWEAEEQYDRINEAVPVYGQVGLGDARYLAGVDEIDARYGKAKGN